jgi:hypothetical protein
LFRSRTSHSERSEESRYETLAERFLALLGMTGGEGGTIRAEITPEHPSARTTEFDDEDEHEHDSAP